MSLALSLAAFVNIRTRTIKAYASSAISLRAETSILSTTCTVPSDGATRRYVCPTYIDFPTLDSSHKSISPIGSNMIKYIRTGEMVVWKRKAICKSTVRYIKTEREDLRIDACCPFDAACKYGVDPRVGRSSGAAAGQLPRTQPYHMAAAQDWPRRNCETMLTASYASSSRSLSVKVLSGPSDASPPTNG
jgi:hypothetical protein